MPKVKGRGKVLRTRTVKVGKNKYMRCDVYAKRLVAQMPPEQIMRMG